MKYQWIARIATGLLLALLVSSYGCRDGNEGGIPTPDEGRQIADPAPEPSSASGHNHDHQQLGPHGGHIVHLQPGDAHAEWTHDDETNTIRVFLEKGLAENVTGVRFVVQIGDQTEEFALKQDNGAWTLTSEALMAHLNMGEAVTTQLVVQTADQQLTAKVEAHEEHHHHHH